MSKFVLFLVLFFSISCIFAAEPDEKLHKSCLYPIVKVAPDIYDSFGSGVIIRSTKISENEFRNVFLTCAHVANTNDAYYVGVYEYEEWSKLKYMHKYPAIFYAINEDIDLAIGVFVSEKEMPTSEVDFATKLYIGSDVFGIGCGLGDDPRLDYGKVTSIITGNGTIRTNVNTLPGDSGSALFHNYKLVGIRRAIRVDRGQKVYNVSYAAPVTSLVKWDAEDCNAYRFAWSNSSMPRMPFYRLKFAVWEINKS